MPEALGAYLDTNALIDFFEVPGTIMDRAFELASQGKWDLHTSEFTLTELLVKPMADGNVDLAARYESFFDDEPILTVHPVTRQVLVRAAEVRARTGVRTADAIHVATAELARCEMFVSFDARIRPRAGMTRIGRGDFPETP